MSQKSVREVFRELKKQIELTERIKNKTLVEQNQLVIMHTQLLTLEIAIYNDQARGFYQRQLDY